MSTVEKGIGPVETGLEVPKIIEGLEFYVDLITDRSPAGVQATEGMLKGLLRFSRGADLGPDRVYKALEVAILDPSPDAEKRLLAQQKDAVIALPRRVIRDTEFPKDQLGLILPISAKGLAKLEGAKEPSFRALKALWKSVDLVRYQADVHGPARTEQRASAMLAAFPKPRRGLGRILFRNS